MSGKTALEVRTFGCRLNLWESETMRGLAIEAGLGDAVIVNTCAVTAEAERQARQAIRRAHRERPETPIIVTGCAAQLDPAGFAAMPGVTRVIGNGVKLAAASWTSREPVLVHDAADLRETAPHRLAGFAANTRGFVQVQQGCDHRCTFCVIPLARGPNRSVPVEDVIAAAELLVETGHREIVLTGVDIASWCRDLDGSLRLGDLVERLLEALPSLPRLRLSSVDPAAIDKTLWRLFATEARLMPHLHLSAQAGDDLVLKQMKRRHLRHHLIEIGRRARAVRPDLAIGVDLIAGFPTETAEQFRRTVELIEEAELDYLHVFPYSPRPGTPAARLPALPVPVVAERAAALRSAGARRLENRLRGLVGETREILMERDGIGRTPCFARVRPLFEPAQGTIVRVRLAALQGDHLTGEAAP